MLLVRSFSVSFIVYYTTFLPFYSLGDDTCGQIIKTDKILSFPWNVGIYLENKNQLELVCFGTFIQSDAIITAAHCFSSNIDGGNIRNNTFYIGLNNLKRIDLKTQSASNFQKINKNRIVTNKNYNGLINFFSNDLAIIKEQFNFSDVKPVCVDWSAEIEEKTTTVKTSTSDKIVDLIPLNPEDCLYEVPKNFASFITSDKLCTKIKATNTHLSPENEGAGLFFLNPDDKQWYIKAVVSSHEPSDGQFSTITPVNRYLNWISNVCANLSH